MKSVFGGGSSSEDVEYGKPIADPFGDYRGSPGEAGQAVTLRSKQGDRTLEVEIPASGHELGQVQFPMLTQSGSGSRGIASIGGTSPLAARDPKGGPSFSDREIVKAFPTLGAEEDEKRRQIEGDLGLKAADSDESDSDRSYLASIAIVKDYFRENRFEQALLETDALLRVYPSDPRIYEMRGTLFERLGYGDLAIKSWEQAIHLNPGNLSLQRYLERKRRMPASVPSNKGGSQ